MSTIISLNSFFFNSKANVDNWLKIGKEMLITKL